MKLSVVVECPQCDWDAEYERLDDMPDYCPNGHQVVDETRAQIAEKRARLDAMSDALVNDGASLDDIAWRFLGQAG